MSCNILQCLTLFENLDDERFKEGAEIVKLNYNLHLSPLKITNDLKHREWKKHYHIALRKRLGP